MDTSKPPEPTAAQVLLTRRVKLLLGVAVAGNALASLVETGAMLLVLPLGQLLTTDGPPTGIAATIGGAVGVTERGPLIITVMAMMFAGFLFKNVFALAFQWWLSGFLSRLGASTSVLLFDRILRGPFELSQQRGLPEHMRAVNDVVMQYYGARITGTVAIATQAISIAMLATALLIAAPVETTALGLFFLLTGFGITRVLRKELVRVSREQLDLSKRGFSALVHGFGLIPELKVRRTYRYFVDEYADTRRTQARLQQRSAFLGQIPRFAMETVFLLGIAGLLVLMVLTGNSDSFTTLSLLIIGGFRLLPTVNGLVGSINLRQSGRAAVEMLDAELQQFDEHRALDGDPASAPLPLERALVLDEVEFRYPGTARNVLEGVSLEIPKGTSLAVVGASGAGKTTLVNLLLGYHRPTGGRILSDDADIAEGMAEWQRGIAFVPQHVFLMDLPLRQNIAIDVDPDAIDENRLQAAIHAAQLDDVVSNLPEGDRTPIGEHGKLLSGGQRQRVGIARALYSEPTVLILDEATSALDNETEHRITEIIESLQGRLTVIVVAHRLSTIKNASQIAVLEDGRVAAIGTFADLHRSHRPFAELVRLASLVPEHEPGDASIDLVDQDLA